MVTFCLQWEIGMSGLVLSFYREKNTEKLSILVEELKLSYWG
jgi:hypothetical protein